MGKATYRQLAQVGVAVSGDLQGPRQGHEAQVHRRQGVQVARRPRETRHCAGGAGSSRS